MSRSQPAPEPLRGIFRELAEADAPELLTQARERARARAQKLMEDALVDELLQAAGRLQATRAAAANTSAVSQHEIREGERSGDRAWWTYCVISSQDATNVRIQLEGIEPGSMVEVLCEGELAALISAVPAAEYNDVRLREHLEDLEWVERTARSHEAVLEAALEQVSIVPLRLCTLYRDRSGVRRLLREHTDTLLHSLAKVDGCAEWGVKVFADESVSADLRGGLEDSVEDVQASATRSGAAYLVERQRERDRAERARELRSSCAEAVHERISSCARESTRNPPQRPELHGRKMPMLLNGAYLVAHERAVELHDSIDALQAEWEPRGFVIELTGAWPAYNFVSGAAGVMP